MYVSWGVGLSRPGPCGMRVYNTDGHVSVAIAHSRTTYYCITGNVRVSFLVVDPVLMAVCASGLWYGL